MFVSWTRDERPRWRVRMVFALDDPLAERGRPDAIRLAQAMASTGHVRAPRAVFRRGELAVDVVVKAVDEMAATVAGLSVLDCAVRDVPGLVLGDLRWRSATPA